MPQLLKCSLVRPRKKSKQNLTQTKSTFSKVRPKCINNLAQIVNKLTYTKKAFKNWFEQLCKSFQLIDPESQKQRQNPPKNKARWWRKRRHIWKPRRLVGIARRTKTAQTEPATLTVCWLWWDREVRNVWSLEEINHAYRCKLCRYDPFQQHWNIETLKATQATRNV